MFLRSGLFYCFCFVVFFRCTKYITSRKFMLRFVVNCTSAVVNRMKTTCGFHAANNSSQAESLRSVPPALHRPNYLNVFRSCKIFALYLFFAGRKPAICSAYASQTELFECVPLTRNICALSFLRSPKACGLFRLRFTDRII